MTPDKALAGWLWKRGLWDWMQETSRKVRCGILGKSRTVRSSRVPKRFFGKVPGKFPVKIVLGKMCEPDVPGIFRTAAILHSPFFSGGGDVCSRSMNKVFTDRKQWIVGSRFRGGLFRHSPRGDLYSSYPASPSEPPGIRTPGLRNHMSQTRKTRSLTFQNLILSPDWNMSHSGLTGLTIFR